MSDDIVDELRQFHHDKAADEIVRLRADNASLMRLVGEEGRANRMTMLYESQRAVLLAIDALHRVELEDEYGRSWCGGCGRWWPCPTHTLLYPGEA